jgi:hypothetical protein
MGGGNLLTRLSHQFSPDSALQVQAYYDYTRRRVPLQYRAVRHTFDLDVQQRIKRGRHSMVFGGGARASDGDDLGDGPGFSSHGHDSRRSSAPSRRTKSRSPGIACF